MNGYPIVPVVFCGSHAPCLLLPGGQWVARITKLDKLLHLKTAPMTLFSVLTLALATSSIVGILPWYSPFLAALIGLLPFPSRIDAEILEPISIHRGEDDQLVSEKVVKAMQAAMLRLAHKRRTPWG